VATSRHLSVRLKAATFDRLDSESRRTGQTRSQLAQQLLEEGLRMNAHPGITFRSGPVGRRPGLVGGPDIWEVARLFQGIPGRSDDAIQHMAELMALTPQQVRVALRYYVEYQDEIDAWIQRDDEEAAQAEAAWHREQALLRS
jgi:hypothetical protein